MPDVIAMFPTPEDEVLDSSQVPWCGTRQSEPRARKNGPRIFVVDLPIST